MKVDIRQVVAVAAEKDIEPEQLIAAVEEAIASAAKRHYKEGKVRAEIDRETGEIRCWKVRKVVEEVKDPRAEITLEEARKYKPDAEVGDELKWPLDTSQLGRIAAQAARQTLLQRVREAERETIYRNYSKRIGEMVNGIVKRIESSKRDEGRGDIIVELGDTEGIVPWSQQIRGERYSQGDRIRAVIIDVTKDASRPQVVLSRTDPRLLERLLEMEVPEIYDGTVVIKGCVRAPGARAKVAVFSRDRDVDPVGACVGLKGSRVQAITRELKGEKVDIIPWSSDLVTFAQHALSPAKINRVAVREVVEKVEKRDEDGNVILDENGEPVYEERTVTVLDVVVSSDQLSLAIGRRGQNVKLASELLGCRIEIKDERAVKEELAAALADMLREMQGEVEAPEEEEEEEVAASPYDYELLIPLEELEGLTERLRERLEEHGIHTVQDVLSKTIDELVAIPGIGPVTAEGLQRMARAALEAAMEEMAEEATQEE